MIKDLFDILPIYEFEEKIDISDWVKENQELGISGEEIVKKYLEKKYKAIVTKMEDVAGYDLWVKMESDEFAVEVKTTEEHTETFFLTITELQKAKKLGDKYNIYRVVKNKHSSEVYIINNPVKTLDIDIDSLCIRYENNFVKIYLSDIKIVLNKMIFSNIPCFEIRENDLK